MKNKYLHILAIGALLTLSACGKKSVEGAVAAATGGKSALSSSEDDWNAKAQGYIEASNDFNSFSTRSNKRADSKEKKLASGDFKAIETSIFFFENERFSMKKLKSTIDSKPAMPAVDDSAKKVVASIDALLPVWSELLAYNKTKKYEDDAGAKGKELLPKYQTGMEQLQNALEAYSAQVSIIAKESSTKNLAKYKADGKLLEMHTIQAISAAKQIVEGFEDVSDFKNEAKITAANTYLAAMEFDIEGIKKEYASRKLKNDKSLPRNPENFERITKELEELAGAYRESRKNPREFDKAVKNYNKAVDKYNNLN